METRRRPNYGEQRASKTWDPCGTGAAGLERACEVLVAGARAA
jgi:hypothetical protein